MSNKLEILKKYAKALNDHDVETIRSLTTEDGEFYAIAGPDVRGTVHKGRDQVATALESAWQNFPDAAWLDAECYMLDENQGVVTSRFKGTALNGDKHEALMVDLFTFEGDKVAIKNAFRKNRPANSGS